MGEHKAGAHRLSINFNNSNAHLGDGALWKHHYFPPQDDQARYRITNQQDLNALMKARPLPEATTGDALAKWRFIRLRYYMRLWTLVLLANILAIVGVFVRRTETDSPFTYGEAATATSTNLFVAALFRHEHFINLLFRLACALPHTAPLCIRRRAAKVYTYGGIHSGSGISAFLWYLCYAALSTRQFHGSYALKVSLVVTTAFTFFLLSMIIGLSHPHVRRCYHNQWEVVHRFAGWTAILLVWAQTLIVVIASAHYTSQTISRTLASTPTFYFLISVTVLLIYPWLRLRRRNITHIEHLSPHAVRLHFSDKILPPCVGYRLSTKPLLENHGFATIPTSPTPTYTPASQRHPSNNTLTYSILVSNAGDWTSALIRSPPRRIWTRGAPTLGVMRIATLFRPVLLVATGSGIGPCLSFLQPYPGHPVRILWSCRRPLKTYGARIVEAVFRADPRAAVVDTWALEEKVDLCALAWAVQGESGAEAVVVISNPRVTGVVVEGLEKRGVPAFGAIFDS